MFTKAIEIVGDFTRPIKFITRNYKDKTVIPGSATMFFVNDEGWAITCKHVAEDLIQGSKIDEQYRAFKGEAAAIPDGKKRKTEIKKLEQKYSLHPKHVAEMKVQFSECVDETIGIDLISHPTLDIAAIRFKGYNTLLYKGHAVFKKDGGSIQPGNMLCRLGYPFPEFADYKYNEENDEINWVESDKGMTPRFPIEGMVTRHLAGINGNIVGIEISTPGLRGQSGGPLFDKNGVIYGMQSMTNHFHLGFDQVNVNLNIGGVQKKISDQPFLHVGQCVHVEMIKEFLDTNNIKYYVGESLDTAIVVNG